MELRNVLAPTATMIFPLALRQRIYSEAWQKSKITLAMRDHNEALAIKTHPLPYLELQFNVENHFPVPLQVFGASVEIWLGKPVVQFYTYLSESLRASEAREGFRAYTFLNNYQSDLLNPPKKVSPPPNATVILTISCRSALGITEKTVKNTWMTPRLVK